MVGAGMDRSGTGSHPFECSLSVAAKDLAGARILPIGVWQKVSNKCL